jgi:hypothetical protein
MEQRLLTQNTSAGVNSVTPQISSSPPSTETKPSNRDQQLLRALYNGEAIAAVYDHTYFEGSNANKDRLDQRNKKQDEQIKQLAKQVVDEAVKQLRNSNTVYTAPGDGVSVSSARDRLGLSTSSSQTINRRGGGGRFSSTSSRASSSSSSSSMLSGLRQLQGRPPSSDSISEQASSTSTTLTGSPMTSSVFIRLQNIFQQRSAMHTGLTTQELLAHFEDLPDQFAPIFREMLRRVATLSEGKWKPSMTSSPTE